MALSKLDLALAAIAAATLIWIEHNHRIVIGPLDAAQAPALTASVCPKTDDAPYSAECIKFIGGGLAPAVLSTRLETRADIRVPPCPPSNESAPDGGDCPR